MAVRDSQDIELTITGPIATQLVRDSQDITLTITKPTTTTVRMSQDILLVISPTPLSGESSVFFVIT